MKKIYLAIAVLLLVILPIRGWMVYATKTEVTDYHIVKTERSISDGESKYLIFAREETLQNVDEWWALKFNSSDIYGKIAAGQTCSFTVTGFRFTLMSWYRNILSADCHA